MISLYYDRVRTEYDTALYQRPSVTVRNIRNKSAGTKESITVKMNHMIRHISYPDFRFPSKSSGEFFKSTKVKKGCNIYTASSHVTCHRLNLQYSFRIHRTYRCNSFNKVYPILIFSGTKLLQKSEMRKNMVMDLIYRGFIYAANYSESHYNPRRSQIKTELRYLFVTTPNR